LFLRKQKKPENKGVAVKNLLLIFSLGCLTACAQLTHNPQSRAPEKVVPPKIINKISIADKKKNIRKFKDSIVKIFAMRSRPNYNQPWQNYPQRSATGSGFVISGNRILTNAHIVADQTFMMVRKPGVQKKYIARLEAIGNECDMAILKVEDPAFFDGLKALELGDLPELQTSVTVMGYPVGGDNISVTEGISSRIEPIVYSHSGRRLLAVQIDAAINPGNSGGPVLFNGKVAGLAFQGLSWGENIGYGIPASLLTHFLDDIEDGIYNGYPELGAAFLNSQNLALRKSIGLPSTKNGAILCYIDPFGSAANFLKSGDALLSINDYAIASDGTIDTSETIYVKAIVARALEAVDLSRSSGYDPANRRILVEIM